MTEPTEEEWKKANEALNCAGITWGPLPEHYNALQRNIAQALAEHRIKFIAVFMEDEAGWHLPPSAVVARESWISLEGHRKALENLQKKCAFKAEFWLKEDVMGAMYKLSQAILALPLEEK